MEPAAEADGRGCTALPHPSIVFLCGDAEHLAGTVKADVVFDGCNKVDNFNPVFFPDSPVPANGVENRSVEVDDSEYGLVGFEQSGILADSVERIDIREKGFVGIEADGSGKIFMLPFMECRTWDDLFLFSCEQTVLSLEDEKSSVGSLLAFVADVYERPGCLHRQAA